MKNTMKRAWEIRRAAAERFACRVSEIEMSECLKMAWREKMEPKTKSMAEIFVELDKKHDLFWWKGEPKEIENGCEIRIQSGVHLQLEVVRGKFVVSGSGFKSYYRHAKAAIEKHRAEFEAALGIQSARRESVRREIEECDGGFQAERV